MKNKLSLLSLAVQKIRLLISCGRKNLPKGTLPNGGSISVRLITECQ